MIEENWRRVDDYIAAALISKEEAQEETLASNARAGLPAIDVSPAQGKLLHLVACAIGAKRVLEIGTLGGYSTIWLARAVGEGGEVVTFEVDPRHAEVARANFAREGGSARVDLRVGPALEMLPKLQAERTPPFDLAFIDADKPNNAAYFAFALALSRPGAVIIVDNVIREGAVADPSRTESDALGARALFDAVAAESRVEATAVQTVGAKGWDGFLIARVK